MDQSKSFSTDLAIGSFIEKWPVWIRWLLFLPAAVIAPIVFFALQSFFAGNDGGIWIQIVGDAIYGGGFVLVGAAVAPRKQFLIALILLVIISILGFLLLLLNFTTQTTNSVLMFIHVLVLIGAGVYVVYTIHNHEAGKNE